MKADKHCKTCKYFKRAGYHKGEDLYLCDHPAIETDDPYTWVMLDMKENDYCSRYEPR